MRDKGEVAISGSPKGLLLRWSHPWRLPAFTDSNVGVGIVAETWDSAKSETVWESQKKNEALNLMEEAPQA